MTVKIFIQPNFLFLYNLCMKYKEEILKILIESEDVVTADTIANTLNVSKKTISNAIKAINTSKEIIISSNKGYSLKRDSVIESVSFVETPSEREEYISWTLLTKKNISLYELSEELCVSSSTIKKDIFNINKKLFDDFSLSIKCTRDILYIFGSETNIRKLFDKSIRNESKDNFTTISFLQTRFPSIDVLQLKVIVHSILQRQGIFVHDFQLISIILHLCIIIVRMTINNDDYTPDAKEQDDAINEFDTATAKKILDKVSIIYPQFVFGDSEIVNFSLVLATNSSKIYHYSNITNYINRETVELTDQIISTIKMSFDIDLSSPSFRSKFMIHLDNLITRMQKNESTKNDLTLLTKVQFPLIYEIASTISYVIKEKYGYDIPEEETSFIAFHIGNEIDEQLQNESKIKCAVIAPDYQQLHYHLANKLTTLYQTKMIIVSVENITLEQYALNTIDLVISTMEIKSDVPYVVVHPFLSANDLSKIDSKINKLIERKQTKPLRINLLHIFDKSLFTINKQFKDEKDVISYMCGILSVQKCIPGHFKDLVLNREKLSSTAFGDYAIPHPVTLCALKTVIFVLITEKPIHWENHQVNFVFLICVNNNEKDQFRDLFSSICNIMSNEKIKQQLLKVKDFDEFIETLSIYI